MTKSDDNHDLPSRRQWLRMDGFEAGESLVAPAYVPAPSLKRLALPRDTHLMQNVDREMQARVKSVVGLVTLAAVAIGRYWAEFSFKS